MALQLVIVCLIAYLNASAIGSLVEVASLPEPEDFVAVADDDGPVRAKVARARADAAPILERNVFDSVTGPLRPPAVDKAAKDNAGPPPVTNPLKAPSCDEVAVTMVTESPDPRWSIATLETKKGQLKMRRVGDEIHDKEVVYIGTNPVEASPAVWLKDDDRGLCQCLLFARDEVPKWKSKREAKEKQRLRKAAAHRAKRARKRAKHRAKKRAKRRRRAKRLAKRRAKKRRAKKRRAKKRRARKRRARRRAARRRAKRRR